MSLFVCVLCHIFWAVQFLIVSGLFSYSSDMWLQGCAGHERPSVLGANRGIVSQGLSIVQWLKYNELQRMTQGVPGIWNIFFWEDCDCLRIVGIFLEGHQNSRRFNLRNHMATIYRSTCTYGYVHFSIYGWSHILYSHVHMCLA